MWVEPGATEQWITGKCRGHGDCSLGLCYLLLLAKSARRKLSCWIKGINWQILLRVAHTSIFLFLLLLFNIWHIVLRTYTNRSKNNVRGRVHCQDLNSTLGARCQGPSADANALWLPNPLDPFHRCSTSGKNGKTSKWPVSILFYLWLKITLLP